MHHHVVTLAHRVGAVAEVVRGHALQHDGRGHAQVHVLRHRDRQGGGHRGLLGVAARDLGPGHPVTHGEVAHGGPDGGYGSGTFGPGHVGQRS